MASEQLLLLRHLTLIMGFEGLAELGNGGGSNIRPQLMYLFLHWHLRLVPVPVISS